MVYVDTSVDSVLELPQEEETSPAIKPEIIKPVNCWLQTGILLLPGAQLVQAVALSCTGKRQYLLTLQVSRYCLLPVQVVAAVHNHDNTLRVSALACRKPGTAAIGRDTTGGDWVQCNVWRKGQIRV